MPDSINKLADSAYLAVMGRLAMVLMVPLFGIFVLNYQGLAGDVRSQNERIILLQASFETLKGRVEQVDRDRAMADESLRKSDEMSAQQRDQRKADTDRLLAEHAAQIQGLNYKTGTMDDVLRGLVKQVSDGNALLTAIQQDQALMKRDMTEIRNSLANVGVASSAELPGDPRRRK
jgi:hypothetical protein